MKGECACLGGMRGERMRGRAPARRRGEGEDEETNGMREPTSALVAEDGRAGRQRARRRRPHPQRLLIQRGDAGPCDVRPGDEPRRAWH